MLEKLPEIFIVGAAKSGTTTLAYLLSRHPNIYMPRKEPGFFAFYNCEEEAIPSEIRPYQVTQLEDYVALYKDKPEGYVGLDASVANLTHSERAISNFNQVFGPEVARQKKYIIILRNPIDRAFSHYKMMLRNGNEELSFEEAIVPEVVASRVGRRSGYDYLGFSLYAERVSQYLKAFPEVKVFLQEDLKDTDKLSKELIDFTELGGTIDAGKNEILNVSGAPKSKLLGRVMRSKPSKFKDFIKSKIPQSAVHGFQKMKMRATAMNVKPIHMSPETREKLAPEFREDILRLQDALQRDLSSWL